jgi:hypothetical protein
MGWRPDDDDEEERAARRTAWFLAVSAGVLALCVVAFFAIQQVRGGGTDQNPAVTVTTTLEQATRVVGGIGPPPGTDVPTYVDARRRALASATGDRLAVVSFTAYTNEAKARSLAGSAEVIALLAAAPGGSPAVVSGDLAGWVTSQRDEAREERDEFQRLLPTVTDAEFRTFYRAEVDRLNQLLNVIRPDGNLVFGLVVRAPVPFLQTLATDGGVRLVDVGESAEPGPRPTYRGLRPEEESRAMEPNTRPA